MGNPDISHLPPLIRDSLEKVDAYNRYLSEFKSPGFWFGATLVNAAIGAALWLITPIRIGFLLIAAPSAVHLLAMFILSKEHTLQAIYEHPYRTAMYSLFYGGPVIYVDYPNGCSWKTNADFGLISLIVPSEGDSLSVLEMKQIITSQEILLRQ